MKTKNKIINTAIKLFNKQGTNLVSTNHIAKAMGISPGNLYYHFSSKNDIIRAISRQFNSELVSIFQFQLDDVSDFSERFTTLFHSFFKMQKSYQFLFFEGVRLVKHDKELQNGYSELKGLIEESYFKLLSNLVKIKLLKKDSLLIVDELLEKQWIIMWYWASYSSIEKKVFDDERIKKGIVLSLSIIKPQLTAIGKITFDKTLQLI
tara:strand:+ start:490 stop:1110 length:621 start_codon:yes stop_codon:yes gene_type:complete